jgi:hypothetical protein
VLFDEKPNKLEAALLSCFEEKAAIISTAGGTEYGILNRQMYRIISKIRPLLQDAGLRE